MEKFFDLKEFLILILKKLKFIITVTLLVTVLFGIYRTYPLVNQYLTYQPHTGDTAKEETRLGYPILTQRKRIMSSIIRNLKTT